MATLPEKIELQVVTPAKHILSEDVQSVELPGKDGYLGILPGHAPLLTELGAGILTFNKGGETRSMTVIDGFAEVLPNRVIVLADESERVEDINAGEARVELEKAQHDLPKAGASEEDWERANAAIARATVRVQAAEKSGSGSGAARELQPTH
ncbi:MAG: F0F1 ATP synthase subunit epsilon [Candidatus Acidiferrales bacterium]|jgi:F-type H+-transporting ATPase subunit epsilon